MTTSDEKQAARSLWLNLPMAFFGSLLFFALGTALYAFYKTQPALLDPTLERADGILPFFILQNLPVGVAGLIVAGAAAIGFAQDGKSELEQKYEDKVAEAWFTENGFTDDYDVALERAKEAGKPIFAYFTRSYAP